MARPVRLVILALLLVSSSGALAQMRAAPLPALSEPAISPDGSEIAFVAGGDIWTVPAGGGEARLLVAHPAMESRPLYAPDGKSLAFVSTRTGNGDVYVLELASGALRRLTFDDGPDQLSGWSPDGRFVYFSSSSQDISGMNDIFRVSVEGGTPMPVSADRYVNEFFAAPSPDGAVLAFSAHGVASAQWWRKGRSHLDEAQIWGRRDTTPPTYEPLTPRGAKDLWPMWSGDGRTLYFVSDRDGHENIWALPRGGPPRPLTRFTSGRVLWPSISRDGREIVFERDFGVWRVDTSGGSARSVDIRLRGEAAGAAVVHQKFTDRIEEMALSPDGKKVAFTVHGEVFAASAKDGGDAARVTRTAARESQLAWAPDSRRLAYVSGRDGQDHVYLYDFADGAEAQITAGAGDESHPLFSPDGTRLAVQRGRKELVVVDLVRKSERVIATVLLERAPLGPNRPFDWSPDSAWLAFTTRGSKLFRNAQVARVDGGTSGPVTFLANVQSASISWSPDGTYLLMHTGQRSEGGHLARIDLVPRTPRFREDQFRDLFKPLKSPSATSAARREPPAEREAAPPSTSAPAEHPARDGTPGAAPDAEAPEPTPTPEDLKGPKARSTRVALDGIRHRVSLLPIGLDVVSHAVSADGKWVAVIASAAGQPNVYAYSLDELAKTPPVAKQLSATKGRKQSLHFTPDGKKIFYLDAGHIESVTLDAPRPARLAVSAEMDVDEGAEKMEVFAQAWRILRDNFFDPGMNGVDWGRVRETYEPRIAAARAPGEIRRLLSLMVGELNASHLGVREPEGAEDPRTGHLGARFDRAEYEQRGALRISEVIPLGPADVAGVVRGEYLLAVGGIATGPRANLDELLEHRVDRRTTITVAVDSAGSGARSVTLKPIRRDALKDLLYRDWVNKNRAYVERASGGRLGYVHMFDMSASALDRLFLDLDVDTHARQGVIVDVRNNNGGFVNGYALDVFSRRGYMNLAPRDTSPAPSRTVLGQRALELPTLLVTNQHSLSDAEDFTEGYRSLKLGRVVGEPTAGWIIYTSNVSLIDGTILRVPATRVTAGDGSDMEMRPRPVDIEVHRDVGESDRGIDTQLDRAVRELLTQLAPSRGPGAARK
jgi:Tol biopolymer transport system component/C-terminal processing protease CtpA/Prc